MFCCIWLHNFSCFTICKNVFFIDLTKSENSLQFVYIRLMFSFDFFCIGIALCFNQQMIIIYHIWFQNYMLTWMNPLLCFLNIHFPLLSCFRFLFNVLNADKLSKRLCVGSTRLFLVIYTKLKMVADKVCQ